jgi:hypothetical protein
MPRTATEMSEHDALVLMMARYFQQQGYTDIKADIPGWTKPDFVYWTNNPENKFYPDLTCRDTRNVFVILEAETCSTLNIQHTQEQFQIFSAHSRKVNGRFEVVVPRVCQNEDARSLIQRIAAGWGITIDNVWIPSS